MISLALYCLGFIVMTALIVIVCMTIYLLSEIFKALLNGLVGFFDVFVRSCLPFILVTVAIIAGVSLCCFVTLQGV